VNCEPQVIVRVLKVLFGLVAVGNILRHHHELAQRPAWIRYGRDIVPDPRARAVGQDQPGLDHDILAGVDGVPEPIEQEGGVVGIAQILHPDPQQFLRRPLQELAKALLTKRKRRSHRSAQRPRRAAEQVREFCSAAPRFDALPHGPSRSGETRSRSADAKT
jgi:hypothetical protein